MSFEVWQAGDVSLYRGDCLEVLPTLATGSVDAVVTDPPYGIGYQSAWRIDTSERFPVLAGDVELSLGWIAGLPRLLRAPAPVFCFCRWDTQELFRQALGESFAVRSNVVWDRGVP